MDATSGERPPIWKREFKNLASEVRNFLQYLPLVVGFVQIADSAMVLGDIVRGSASPWVWEEMRHQRHAFGRADAVLAVICYLVFYAGLFAWPYILTRSILAKCWPAGLATHPEYQSSREAVAIGAAVAVGLPCLTFLGAIAQFLDALPSFWITMPVLVSATISMVVAGLCIKRLRELDADRRV